MDEALESHDTRDLHEAETLATEDGDARGGLSVGSRHAEPRLLLHGAGICCLGGASR